MSMRAYLVNISLILTYEIVHFHSPMADNRTKEIFEALMARDAVYSTRFSKISIEVKELPGYLQINHWLR